MISKDIFINIGVESDSGVFYLVIVAPIGLDTPPQRLGTYKGYTLSQFRTIDTFEKKIVYDLCKPSVPQRIGPHISYTTTTFGITEFMITYSAFPQRLVVKTL